MSWTRFFRRSRWDDERARELEAHLAIETDDNIARGMSRGDGARRGAAQAGQRHADPRGDLPHEHLRPPRHASGRISATARGCCGSTRASPPSPSSRWRSASAPTPPSSSCSTRSACARCRSPHPEQLVEIRIAARPTAATGSSTASTRPDQPAVGADPRSAGGVLRRRSRGARTDFELTTGGEARRAQGLWVSGDSSAPSACRRCSAACSPPPTIAAAAPRRRR